MTRFRPPQPNPVILEVAGDVRNDPSHVESLSSPEITSANTQNTRPYTTSAPMAYVLDAELEMTTGHWLMLKINVTTR